MPQANKANISNISDQQRHEAAIWLEEPADYTPNTIQEEREHYVLPLHTDAEL